MPDEKSIRRTYVYAGVRFTSDDHKLYTGLIEVLDPNTPGPKLSGKVQFFSQKNSRDWRVIGGVYEVTSGESGDTIYTATSEYQHKWPVSEHVAEWEALDAAARGEMALYQKQKRDGENSELLNLLKPLRRAWTKTNYTGKRAIELEMLAALRTPEHG